MINYQEIIDGLTDERVKQLLDNLDIPYTETANELIMPTYCHHHKDDEASQKLYYYKNTHIFYCYSNCGPQSIFKFLQHYYEAQGIEYDWFRDIYEVILGCSTYSNNFEQHDTYKSQQSLYIAQKQRQELPRINEGLLNVFQTHIYVPEWLNDGITAAAMDKFNIRYSINQNKIIIPHYDVNHNLVGIRGRALDPWEIENVGKYMPVQIEGKFYAHPLSLNLYGLDQNKENIRKSGYAIICESEKSVLQAENFNMPNCVVAVCGSKINKYHIDLLCRTCAPREIIIAFDKEQVDYDTYFMSLYRTCQKYLNYCNLSFIYDDYNLLNQKDSPTDKGEEVFKKLLSKRVKLQ